MNELFGKNVKAMRIFIAIYILLAIVVLALIWWPKNTKADIDFNYYKEYTQEEVAEKMAQYYVNDIYTKIILQQVEDIVDNVDTSYLEYNELKKDDITDYLNAKNIFNIETQVSEVTVNTNGNDYIYSFDLINGSNSVRINLIEEYPYKYKITFNDFVSYKKLNYKTQHEKFELTVQEQYNSIGYIEYELEITNNDYASLEFNLAAVTDAYITYSDGSRLALANPIKYDNEKLEKGGSIRKVINFELPINVQAMVEQLVFTNVVIEGKTQTITIDI